MPGINIQTARTGVRVAVLVGAFIALGALAWGIGWVAHGLFDRRASLPPPVSSESTEGRPTAMHSPTGSPDPSPSAVYTSSSDNVAFTPGATDAPTPVPATSTPAPTTGARVQEMTVETNDRGVYDVIRRACGLPSSHVLSPGDVIIQETWKLNEFIEESPHVETGQAIQVPIHLCP